MIRIQVEWTHLGNRLEMSGHAGMKDQDNDIDLCCCACSTILYTWCAHLMREEAAGRLSFRSQQLEKGFGSVRATAADGEYLRLKAGFDTVIDGIKLLREKYPEAIQITYINNDKKERSA